LTLLNVKKQTKNKQNNKFWEHIIDISCIQISIFIYYVLLNQVVRIHET